MLVANRSDVGKVFHGIGSAAGKMRSASIVRIGSRGPEKSVSLVACAATDERHSS